ncbi:ROK family transcriptional regulator [Vallitalea okinawensis]|uniref:ROK family transcriptional regulator n=1 Tax=Vallitalea okinawensis TaxID=2078660 RepID=UPI000CFD76B4|nr:ROK family transcriptional regulator [Vallitalea okinawensis]
MNKLTSPDMMKLKNIKSILKVIHEDNGIYRKKIAEKINLSSQTVTNIVKELLDKGIIKEESVRQMGQGRNPMSLRINYTDFYVIGVEVTVTEIKVVLTNLLGDLIKACQKQLAEDDDALNVIKQLIDEVKADFSGINRIQAVAISVTGVVNEKKGIIIEVKPLNWFNINLKKELEYLGIPILIRNDVNTIAHSENFNLREDTNFIVVKLDQGIGSSIVIDGHVMRSTNSVAGEFGHITVNYAPEVRKCKCGKYGCLTTLASIGALEERLDMNYERIKEEVKKGNTEVTRMIEEVSDIVAPPLANVVILLDLDRIVLTGKFINDFRDIVFEKLSKKIRENLTDWVAYKDLNIHENVNLAILSAKLLIDHYFENEEDLLFQID